jgi:hypothetical protein
MEIFEAIKAINRLSDHVVVLTTRIDSHIKAHENEHNPKYVDERRACEILFIKSRTLAKMRADGQIPYRKIGKKNIFLTADLYEYIESTSVEH